MYIQKKSYILFKNRVGMKKKVQQQLTVKVKEHLKHKAVVGCNDTFSHDTIHISIQGPRYDTRYDTLLCATKLVTNNLHYF